MSIEKSWYVIHTYSGYEGRVKTTLEERVKTLGLEEKVGRLMVPTEEVSEFKDGKRRVSTRKFFPGYVFAEMVMDDEIQQLVKNIPKVTNILGGVMTPFALSAQESERILKQADEGVAPSGEAAQFNTGDTVRIVDGPFLGFTGVVDELNMDQGKVKVLVSIFGRGTPVELRFPQIERP